MPKKMSFVVVCALLAVAGCVSQTQMLDNDQAMAVQTAVSRARFDMNCSTATGQVNSREMVQPALQGPFVNGFSARNSPSASWDAIGERVTSWCVLRAAMDASRPAQDLSIATLNRDPRG